MEVASMQQQEAVNGAPPADTSMDIDMDLDLGPLPEPEPEPIEAVSVVGCVILDLMLMEYVCLGACSGNPAGRCE